MSKPSTHHVSTTRARRAGASYRAAGTLCVLALASVACTTEPGSTSRAASDLDLTAFGVAAIAPDDTGYLLLDRSGEVIGNVEIDVDDTSGSLRVSLADSVGELSWTDQAGHATCDAVAGSVLAAPRRDEPGSTAPASSLRVSDAANDPVACGAALAIASEIASVEDLDVPMSPERPAVDLASYEPDDDLSFRTSDCGEVTIEHIAGCISWSAELGCIDWMMCVVYICENPAYHHHVCFINW